MSTATLNRTILELKLGYDGLPGKKAPSLNRTILELKQLLVDLLFGFISLSIAPFWN